MDIDDRLYVRLREEEKAMLRQMFERYRFRSMSAMIRALIRMAYNYDEAFEFYLEKENK